MRALIIGCGYVGYKLALDLARLGHTVDAVRRTVVQNDNLDAAGVRILAVDISNPDDLRLLETNYDWVVDCAAPSSGGPEAYQRVYLEGIRNLVNHFRNGSLQKLVYTSSSAVYAQDDGSEVSEASPAAPETETGKILREAETVLLNASRQLSFPGIVLRVSGIYGPGRTYWLKMFLTGEIAAGPSERCMNMIHRDDVVGAIIAALKHGRAGEIYNVCDNEPVKQKDLFAWLADQTGKSAPGPRPSQPGEPHRRTVTNKRISNHKLREKLGYVLKYPTFREGYAAELDGIRSERET